MLIHPYSATWITHFESIKNVLDEALQGLQVNIEHVGSTAVPGLAAKPIIDIDIVFQHTTSFIEIKQALEAIGYFHNGNQGIEDREVFKRIESAQHEVLDAIRHHLYVCSAESPALERHLVTRDYLRLNEKARAEYQQLKYDLAEKAGQDQKKYATLKEQYVNPLIDGFYTSTNNHNELKESNNTMEVHHHAHHDHGKKTWKSYFWEFFMLFLAVLCGFLAELQLEHYIENQREKKYVSHLMQDLAKDSVNLIKYLGDTKNRNERIDTMLQILINKESATKGNELYYHARRIVRAPTYFPSDASILQLKYSGNFRLIHDANIVKQIGSYENETRELIYGLEEWRDVNADYRESLESIFDGAVFYSMLNLQNVVVKPTNNPQLINTNQNDINKLIIKVQFMKGGANRSYFLAEKCLTNCIALQKAIREKYKL